jgi:septum formation protein
VTAPEAQANPRRRLVLASASRARRQLLRRAGFDPEIIESGIDEHAVQAADPAGLALARAEAKAAAVVARLAGSSAIVIGCDSLLDVDGEVHGKPASAAEAAARLRVLRGRTTMLHTGHVVTDVASGRSAAEVASTKVWFGDFDDDELAAYVATGEPLEAAGAFTLDGYAAPFMGGVEGDPSNVIRVLLRRLGIRVYDLWRAR